MIRKPILAVLATTLAVTGAAADIYVVDRTHSEASFQVRHMMVAKVRGYFTDFAGTIHADAEKPESSSVEFTVRTASVDTANEKRDAHLRSADFFEADKHPEMTFKSTRIKPLGDERYEVTGAFTLKGVTKEITVPVTFLGLSPNKAKAGFETTFTINRKDYGLLWNRALDGGGIAVSDEVQVTVNVEADRQKDAPATR